MFFLSGEARACGISHPGRMFDKLPAEFYNKLVALPLGFETKRAEQPEGDESMTAAKKRIPAFPPLLKKIFRFVSMTLATLMLVALFYLAVVLGQPQEPENPITVSQDQPLLAACPEHPERAADLHPIRNLSGAYPGLYGRHGTHVAVRHQL